MNENNELNQNTPLELNANHSSNNQKNIIIFIITIILIFFGLIYLIILELNQDSNSSLEQQSSSSSVVENKIVNLHYDYYEDVESVLEEYLNPVFNNFTSDGYNKINENGELITPHEDNSNYFTISKKYTGNASVISFIDVAYAEAPNFIVLTSNHELYHLWYVGQNADIDEEVISIKIKTTGPVTGLIGLRNNNGFEGSFEGCDDITPIVKIASQLYYVDYYEDIIQEYIFDYNGMVNVIGGYEIVAPISIDDDRYLIYYNILNDEYDIPYEEYNDADANYSYNQDTGQKIKVKYMIKAYDQEEYGAYVISNDNKLYVVNNDTDFTNGIKEYATIVKFTKSDNKINIILDNHEELIFEYEKN